jgi:transcription factor CP2-like protein
VPQQPLSADAHATEVAQWLRFHRFSSYVHIFQSFSGADLLRLSREDLIQICGLADGIRLDNVLQARNIRPRLTIYICQEPESIYHAVYMDSLILEEFKIKLSSLFGIQTQQIGDIYMQGPSQIHILLTDEVIQNTQDQARFVVEGMKDESGDKYRILLKTVAER